MEHASEVDIAAEEQDKALHAQRESRDELILRHLGQVRMVALRLYERLPGFVNLEDLISAGTVGLISAIDRYEAMRNVKLTTYAEYKIRGAILDALRDLDWAPRQRRRRVKAIEAAAAGLEQDLQRAPSAEEVAARLGITIDEYHRWNSDATGVSLCSLDNALSDEGHIRPKLSVLADGRIDSPAKQLEKRESENIIAQALRHMPKSERTVLQLYFFEDLTLREIASVMSLHESRISQLKGRALSRLREALGNGESESRMKLAAASTHRAPAKEFSTPVAAQEARAH